MTDLFIQPAPAVDFTSSRLIFVLDRSGSMSSMRDDAIGGFNSFVEAQLKQPGKATLTLVQFDNHFEVNYSDLPLEQVVKLDTNTFVPRGGTALYDAVGRTLANAIATDSPDVKTIITVLTDGEENGSREFSFSSVSTLMKQVQDERGWEVLFVGANISAQAVGASMGIKGANIATFDGSAKGMSDVMQTVSCSSASYRSVSKFSAAEVSLQDTYASVKSSS